MQYVTLSNGVKMPILGYGVYQVTREECERCILDALEVGYRSIDTAQSYFNEEQVGSAIVKSGVLRQNTRTGHAALAYPARCGRHPKVHSQGAHEREFRGV